MGLDSGPITASAAMLQTTWHTYKMRTKFPVSFKMTERAKNLVKAKGIMFAPTTNHKKSMVIQQRRKLAYTSVHIRIREHVCGAPLTFEPETLNRTEQQLKCVNAKQSNQKGG